MFIIATLTDHCIQQLIKCKGYLIDAICQEQRKLDHLPQEEEDAMRLRLARDIGYGDIGQLTFGPWCYHLIQGAVWFTQYMTCISYLIFIANAVFEIYPMVPALFPLQNGSYAVEAASRATVVNPSIGVPMLNIYGVESSRGNKRSLPDFSPFGVSPNYYFDSVLNVSNVVEFFGNDTSPVTVEPPTSVVPTTTTTRPSTTPGRNTTAAPVPTPTYVMVTTAPSLKYIVLFPVAFFILTSLLRNLRSISLFSGIAAAALSVGAGSVFIYLLIGESDGSISNNMPSIRSALRPIMDYQSLASLWFPIINALYNSL